jgi:LemA protein
MKKSYKILIIVGSILLMIFIGFNIYKNSYNKIIKLEESVAQQWANVESQYQRRLDLIPNLVNTVKGYAEFEQETLTKVIEARAKATAVNINADNLNAQTFDKFQQAQGELSSALSRLMVVVEKYPDLKANQNFLELQAQLEGTENRISVERMRFNDTVKSYNEFIRSFWVSIFFKKEKKEYFKAEEAAAKAPEVKF